MSTARATTRPARRGLAPGGLSAASLSRRGPAPARALPPPQQPQEEEPQQTALGAAVAAAAAAPLVYASQADAAQEVVGQLASDQRLGVLALLLAPALGWVGFNILGPGLNQLDDMNASNAKSAGKKRAIVGGLGLSAASLLAAGRADAAQEVVGQLASDQRLGVLALLLAPALGWVGFNILGPGLNQLDDMNASNAKSAGKKRAIVGGLGLSAASLLAAGRADAAQEVVGQLASDQRLGVLALLLAPALGWVGFNILGPGLNQLDDMNASNAKSAGKAKKGR